MPKIIQFMHRGVECDVKHLAHQGSAANGMLQIRWNNTGDHYRRLIRHSGQYVDKHDRVHSGDLAFWNEWEAQTLATASVPHVHSVCVPNPAFVRIPKNGKCCCNTDPCVFGRTFKYSNCHQSKNGAMRKLDDGSLILFGSHKGGKFLLDTVFVVDGKGVDYKTPTNNLVVPQIYRDLTIDRLPAGEEFTFYLGRVPIAVGSSGKVDESKIFSYTPSKLFGATGYNNRCEIDFSQLRVQLPLPPFAPNLTQGFKVVARNASTNQVEDVWSAIRQDVENQGFVLGTHFEWPKLRAKW